MFFMSTGSKYDCAFMSCFKYQNTFSYIPITGCVLSHILSCSELSSHEKMYYILVDSLSYINSSKGRNRSISLPAQSWAERLSCSKSEVFILQKSLEDKGYFIIHRDKNDKGQNNRNIITTTIPDKTFNDLKYEPDRFNLSDADNKVIDHSESDILDSIDKTFIPTLEGKRQYLEKTKMFIRVPYQFLKQLNSNCSIAATSKVIMLYLFTKIYKSSAHKYKYDDSNSASTHKSYYIVTSYRELQKELTLHRNSISKALKDLEATNLISKQRFFIKDTEDYNSSRADKSLWKISLLNELIVTNHNNHYEQTDQEEQNGQQQVVISDQSEAECNNNKSLESSKERECTKYDPACTDSGQLYNKDFLLKNSIIKNIDYIDANCEDVKNSSAPCSSYTLTFEQNYKKEFFEDKLCLSSSEFYNNSSFFNNSCMRFALSKQKEQKEVNTKSSENGVFEKEPQQKNQKERLQNKQKEEQQELRHFYPLSEKDVRTLNFRSNREFSTNFVNQLLLKLYIKYPEKRFKNKFTFLSYMQKALKNEKHQGPLVNHTTFRFRCNINAEEKNLLEYEKYLSQIENAFDTSKETQLKKKIAGRFSTEVAYEILTQVEFKMSLNDSFITALIPSLLDLSARQIEILSEQLEAVYGRNRFMCRRWQQTKREKPRMRGKR